RKRYTSNLAVIDEMPLLDLLNDVILVSCRGFFSQGANGKLRLKNKKPADYAYGISGFTGGTSTIDVDNAEPWVNDPSLVVVIDAHSSISEVHAVRNANFPTSQNSTTLVSDHPAEIVVT